MSFLYHRPNKHRWAKTYTSFAAAFLVLPIFFIIQFMFIQNTPAAGLTLTGNLISVKDEKPVVRFHDILSQVIVAHTGDHIANLRSHVFTFESGGVPPCRYKHERCSGLKTIVGWVFTPLFYGFNHPIIFLFVLFCLSILWVLFDDFNHRSKKENLSMLTKTKPDCRKN
jgi:hypothetical protein